VDTLDPAAAVADVRWPDQVCSRQGVVISCLVENVPTATLTTLGLIVTTQDTYSGTLSNTAVITGMAGTVDSNASNNNAGPVIVAVVSSPPSVIYLPLVLRNFEMDDLRRRYYSCIVLRILRNLSQNTNNLQLDFEKLCALDVLCD